MIKLDERLQAIADCVDKGAVVADIGCDHGKVVVWLVDKGIARQGLAIDISDACLDKAKHLAQLHCVEDKIKFICDNGLPDSEYVDNVIIAGLGADEIIKILSKITPKYKLILCPHKDPAELRKYLANNRYYIYKDFIIKSKGKFYPIIVAKMGTKSYNRKWFYFGTNSPRSQYFLEYLNMRKEYILNLLSKAPRLEDSLMEEWEEAVSLTQLVARDIANAVEQRSPLSLQLQDDNSGLQVGNLDAKVSKILVALDASLSVISQAISLGCDMIVAHHPIFFKPIKQFDTSNYYCNCLAQALTNNITIYSSHTNFDIAPDCLNAKVALMCLLSNIKEADLGDGYLARIGDRSTPLSLSAFADELRKTFGGHIATVGNPSKLIKKVFVVNGGAGGNTDYLDIAKALGADAFVTGDVKHHVALYAKETDFALVSFGHYESEIVFVDLMKNLLEQNFPSLEVLVAESSSPFNQ